MEVEDPLAAMLLVGVLKAPEGVKASAEPARRAMVANFILDSV